jgi:3-hydroxybutyryl-CoA dehydrogenase
MKRILILGSGLMGSQIGCEYALAGHEVTLSTRDPARAAARANDAFAMVERLELAASAEIETARGCLTVAANSEIDSCDLVVESLPEDFELKVRLLESIARDFPDAVIATNTSSLSISALGRSLAAETRVLGVHYWNPPLLMPLVEVIPGADTDPTIVREIVALLEAVGKRPVLAPDVPGFVWNRLQMAVLRECVWLIEHGGASAEAIDTVLAEGLSRRWRHIGLFDAIRSGGVQTWEQLCTQILPSLSSATELPTLRSLAEGNKVDAQALALRDSGLAAELRAQHVR